jgi:hypothetical protein
MAATQSKVDRATMKVLYEETHPNATLSELAGVEQAVDRINENPETAVTARLALDVAINDGGQDWPEVHRRAAMDAYGLRAKEV